MKRKEARRVRDFYRESARPFIEEHQSSALPALDRCGQLLDTALERSPRVSVGFLGESQVGKSSLVNALLDTVALPAGGIGPLTAMETRVEYDTGRALEVAYHGEEKIRELAKILHGHLLYQGQASAGAAEVAVGAAPDSTADDEDDAPPAPIEGPDAEDARRRRDDKRAAMELMLGQARKIVCGNDDPWADPLQLDDRLVVRSIFAAATKEEVPSDLAVVRQRVLDIRRLLGTREVIRDTGPEGQGFEALLATRSAGWMAPLVSELTVRLDGELARAMSMVDLPGIGVVGDPAGDKARKFVEGGADTLVVVVRNNGVTNVLADLMKRSGVIARMLFGGGENANPIHVIIAVTHLDDVAKDEHRRHLQRARATGTTVPTPDEIFTRISASMADTIRQQLQRTLLSAPELDDFAPEQRTRQEEVVRQLCREVQVFCVSAPSYTDLKLQLSQSFLTSVEATGIPALRAALMRVAEVRHGEVQAAVQEAHRSLLGLVVDHLDRLELAWQEGGAALGQWEEFRRELDLAAAPLHEEMVAYHASFHTVLKEVVPRDIEALCNEAGEVGRKRLKRLRSKSADLYWPSLDAALRNDGVWKRRNLNYPHDITEAMVEAIAALWDPKVVQSIRAALKELVQRDLTLVDQLCEVARAHEKRISSDPHIEAQKRILTEEARSAVALTKERLEELKANVQKELFEEVAAPIAEECRRIRRLGKNRGPGAKGFIIEALETGGEQAVLKARDRAARVLKRHYDRIVGELAKDFLPQIHDPVGAAVAALTDEQHERAARVDSKRRKAVLEGVGRLRAGLSPQRTLAEERA